LHFEGEKAMPGKPRSNHLQQPYQADIYPLSIVTMANLPTILIPQQVAENIALRYLYQNGGVRAMLTLSREEEAEFIRYGYRSRLPIHIPGDIINRTGNIVQVDSSIIHLGDVPFALFMRLVAELFKNKSGMIRKSRLINGGYIKADGEYQAISRLRQFFRTALRGFDPQDFIEACQPGYLRLSTHPALITYNKPNLLSHRNIRIRKLAKQLP